VALAGNPNVGKSTLFNALTGLHQKVSNFPGVTVERRLGVARTAAGPVEVLDLPGTYGLAARTQDEEVARAAILGGPAGEGRPDLVVLVLDATNLSRHLYFAIQVLETGVRCVAALNQADAAEEQGIRVDAAALARALGVPVVPTVGRTGRGVEELRAAVAAGGAVGTPPHPRWRPEIEGAAALLAAPLAPHLGGRDEARRLLPEILGSEWMSRELAARLPPDLAARLERERGRLALFGVDTATATAEARYRVADAVSAETVRRGGERTGWRERLDRAFTHPVSGSLVLLGVFSLVFVAVFAWAKPLMEIVGDGLGTLADGISATLPAGLLAEFLAKGLVAGFAGVLTFVPQILVMFLLVEILEDSGYLARAAFLLDRAMGRAGLPGRAFLPLVSSFACAIPGIMSTRTIENRKDRIATTFVAPFMSCSARLPVYLMVVGALFSTGTVLGFLPTGAAVMIAMYLLGIAAGLVTAKLLRKTVLRGGRSSLLLELPSYHLPSLRAVALNAGRRTWAFVKGAGSVIVAVSVVLWALTAFPREVDYARDYGALHAAAEARAATRPAGEGRDLLLESEHARIHDLRDAERREKSYAGRLGKTIEPVLAPLGMDWKMGIGVIASFAAREVFVSTLAVVYAAGSDRDGVRLREAILADRDPATGRPVFRPLVGISLLVFFVLAMQCFSTLAVVRKETGTWKWPLLMFAWMTGLAYGASFLVYQVGSALGF